MLKRNCVSAQDVKIMYPGYGVTLEARSSIQNILSGSLRYAHVDLRC